MTDPQFVILLIALLARAPLPVWAQLGPLGLVTTEQIEALQKSIAELHDRSWSVVATAGTVTYV